MDRRRKAALTLPAISGVIATIIATLLIPAFNRSVEVEIDLYLLASGSSARTTTEASALAPLRVRSYTRLLNEPPITADLVARTGLYAIVASSASGSSVLRITVAGPDESKTLEGAKLVKDHVLAVVEGADGVSDTNSLRLQAIGEPSVVIETRWRRYAPAGVSGFFAAISLSVVALRRDGLVTRDLGRTFGGRG